MRQKQKKKCAKRVYYSLDKATWPMSLTSYRSIL
jgi:hypothetical protein